MKKHFTKFLAVMFSIATLLSMPTTAFAANTPHEDQTIAISDIDTAIDGTIVTYAANNRSYWMGRTMSYTQIPCSFPASGGIFSVIVQDFKPNDYRMDIVMVGRNGVLWQEEDCLHNNSNRAFECSHEVTSISLRIVPRNRLLFPAQPKDFLVKVAW